MSQRRSRINVQGMSCANCSQTIADPVTSLDGVSEANIDFATDEGSVEHDPDEVTLDRIFDAIEDATLAKIKQNIVWALGYITAMILLASLGLLQPVLAAGAMAFSSVSVLSNSLPFRRYTPDHDYELLGVLRR